ncbi:MAG: NUDIX domain-containing protein [Chloroflexi bacterium]|nr:NUDIX domain-containing protein [Chloroflexota bacterium]
MTHRCPTLPASDASVYGAASSPRADDAELLSLVDASGHPLPCSAPRAMVHRAGLWHRSFHCWLVRLGPQGPVLLLQRRAWAKATWPGAWDVSAAGHYLAGEGLAGGCREIAEELGIRVEASALTWLGRHREVVRYASGLRDREYQDVYVLYDDRPLGAYAPDPEEVIGLALVAAGALAALAAGTMRRVWVPARLWDGQGWQERRWPIPRHALVTRVGSYYRWVARGAARLLRPRALPSRWERRASARC